MHFLGFAFTVILLLSLTPPCFAVEDIAFLPNRPMQRVQIEKIPQWNRIVQNYNKDKAIYARCVESSSFCPNERLKIWGKFVHAIKDEPQEIQAAYVNGWFNRMPYREDKWIYGQRDHWADLAQFLQYSGDCEDFSIAKYITLRVLGFSSEQLKVAMVYDVYSGTDHAFTIARVGLSDYILDSRDAAMEPGRFVARYQPHYAFNEDQVWVYKRPVMARSIRKDNPQVMPGNR